MFSSIDGYLDEDEVLEASINPSLFDSRNLRWHLIALVLLAANAAILYTPQLRNTLPDMIGEQELLFGFSIPLLIMAIVEIRRRFIRYHFTDRKLVRERGILNKHFLEIQYDHITETRLQKPVYERIFGVGDIYVNTAGQDTIELLMHGIRDPEKYKVKISSKSSVAHMPHTAPASGPDTISSKELDAELTRIQQRRDDLEQAFATNQISQHEYNRQWYLLEGEERVVQHLFNRVTDDTQQAEN